MEGGGVVKDERRLVASPFLVKTYRLVDDSSTDHIVSWGKHNNTLVVWRPRELSASVLPRYFSHTNFSSFVRQLNTYGFRKIVRGRCEFGNELFRKGQKHLLSHIQRRKPSISLPLQTMELAWQTGYHQSLIPNSASRVQDSDVPPAAPCLSEENEILKRNNLLLLSEIECLQNICVRNFKLFIRHNTRDPALIDRKIDEVSSSVSLTNVAEEISRSPPKLFGVPLR